MKKEKIKTLEDLNELNDFNEIPKEEIPVPKEDVKSSSYLDRIKKKRERKKQKKLYEKSKSAVLVRIELHNGQHDEKIVKKAPEQNGFFYEDGFYFFIDKYKYYVRSSNMFAYDYHEGLSIPVERRIPIDIIKEHIKSLKMTVKNLKLVEMATEPLLVSGLMKSEVIRQMLQGMKIHVLLKILIVAVAVVFVTVIGDFIIDIYDSGIIESFNK